MAGLDYVPVDADNHYYEPHDCCSRHLESKYRDEGRVCHVAKDGTGQDLWHFGDRPLSFHRTTRDMVLPPGAYRPFMSSKPKPDPGPPPKLQSSNIPQFRDKDARIKTLDKLATISITSQGASKHGRPTAQPSELFKRNVWVAPFFEDDVPRLVEQLGAENVLFGSDWPHPEGVAAPMDFLEEIETLNADQIRLIMRENTAGLLGL